MPDYMQEFDDEFEFKDEPDETTPMDADNFNVAIKNTRLLKRFISDVITGNVDLIVGNIRSKNLIDINNKDSIKENVNILIQDNSITITTNNTLLGHLQIPFDYEPNKEITLSFKAVYTNDSNPRSMGFFYFRKDKTNTQRNYLSYYTTLHEYKWTGTLPEKGYGLWFYVEPSDTNDSVSVKFSDIQVEYGAEKTSYAPHIDF